jgi:hypothetical protein
MILFALLLLAQDVPAAAPAVPDTAGEDIVVRATLGRTTMLFDKGTDGRLRNCRIMVSSGSQKRDTEACQATPVCYAKTADEVTECVELTVFEPRASAPAAPGTGKPAIIDMPKLARPQPRPATALGPSTSSEESRETERQRVKLPPLPQAPTDGPVVKFTSGKAE